MSTEPRILGDWLESYMEYTNESEPPDSYRLWSGISTIAAVLRRKVFLLWHAPIYPNMYIVLIGPPGRCRKGTAMGQAQPFLRELGIRLSSNSITREALIRELQEAKATDHDEEGIPIYHASLTVFSKELTVFLGYKNNVLMSDLTDWYDCDDHWIYKTKTQGEDHIIGVWLNLVGATTPELIRSSLPEDMVGSGLASRCIFVYEENKGKIVVDPFITQKHTALQQKLISDLWRISSLSGQFRVTEDFIERWCGWYPVQDRETDFHDPRFAGYLERRPTHLLKLSTILSASRSDDKLVSSYDFDRALRILKQVEVKMPYTFQGMGRNPQADLLMKILVFLEARKEVTHAELLQRFYNDADDRTLNLILDTLVNMKYVLRAGSKLKYVGKRKDTV